MEKQDMVPANAPTPAALISQALQNDVDMDKLQKLMDMQEKWEKKEATKAFKMAMSKFQAERPKLVKDSKVEIKYKDGGTSSYNFKSLAGIQEVVDPILGKNGLSYRWKQDQENDKISITCIVSHLDGHEEETRLSAGADTSGSKNNIQSIGSTVSYLKRYTLEAALGLSSDMDDDGDRSKTLGDGSKPMVNDKMTKKIMDAIKAGRVESITQITDEYNLTKDQYKIFETVIKAKNHEKNKDKPKSN